MNKIHFKKSGCDGFPLWEWALTVEIQHNTSALHNVIRSAIRLRAPEKKSWLHVSYFHISFPFYVIGSNKEYFEFEFEFEFEFSNRFRA